MNNMDNKENVVSKNEKNKFLIPVFIVIGVLLLIGVGVVVLLNKDEEVKPPEIENKEPEKELTEEEAGLMINDLMLVGIEIYDSGRYLDFPKSGSMYYATKGDLRKMGYTNIDELVQPSCSDGHSVLFFDVDNAEQYSGGYPIMTVYDCSDFIVE